MVRGQSLSSPRMASLTERLVLIYHTPAADHRIQVLVHLVVAPLFPVALIFTFFSGRPLSSLRWLGLIFTVFPAWSRSVSPNDRTQGRPQPRGRPKSSSHSTHSSFRARSTSTPVRGVPSQSLRSSSLITPACSPRRGGCLASQPALPAQAGIRPEATLLQQKHAPEPSRACRFFVTLLVGPS